MAKQKNAQEKSHLLPYQEKYLVRDLMKSSILTVVLIAVVVILFLV